MTLLFITGNAGKFSEMKSILGDIEQLKIDLPEIQEIDPRAIIEHKLNEARKHHSGEFIIEDTSLYFQCFDFKLPGPLVKWFEKALGSQGLLELVEKYGDNVVECRTIIG